MSKGKRVQKRPNFLTAKASGPTVILLASSNKTKEKSVLSHFPK